VGDGAIAPTRNGSTGPRARFQCCLALSETLVPAAVLPRTDEPASDDFLHENIGVMLEHCKGIAWALQAFPCAKTIRYRITLS
jgi:hypothetical protein